jgi:hypothetical protein
MAKMKSFTEADWSGWAGVEGTDPRIGEVDVITNTGRELGAVIISAPGGVHLYCVSADGSISRWYRLDRTEMTQERADAIAALLPDIVQHQLLLDMGFFVTYEKM